jgi:hypothetical protein
MVDTLSPNQSQGSTFLSAKSQQLSVIRLLQFRVWLRWFKNLQAPQSAIEDPSWPSCPGPA